MDPTLKHEDSLATKPPANPNASPLPSKDSVVGRNIHSAGLATHSLQVICHRLAEARGWWVDFETGESLKDPIHHATVVPQKLLLIHTEISEATEGYRKGKMDDHLPNRTMIEVELADAIIRIADLAGALDMDLGGALAEKLAYNYSRTDHSVEDRKKEGGKKF